jgi:hypothetical protein
VMMPPATTHGIKARLFMMQAVVDVVSEPT